MHDVSVIIPTADRMDLINRAIDSVLAQSAPAAEIIVVDNGVAPVVLREDLVSRVTILRTEARIGPGRSRNAGVEVASAEYVAFLDDDDYWQPEYLGESAGCLGDADVVVGRLMRQSVEGEVRPYKTFPSKLEQQRKLFYCNPGFGGQNIMFKKSLFESLNGFDVEMPASVDRDLAARVLRAGHRILVQPLSVAVLCDHDGDRVRGSQIRGNWMFIKKHWRGMQSYERYKALRTLLKRYYAYKLLKKSVD